MICFDFNFLICAGSNSSISSIGTSDSVTVTVVSGSLFSSWIVTISVISCFLPTFFLIVLLLIVFSGVCSSVITSENWVFDPILSCDWFVLISVFCVVSVWNKYLWMCNVMFNVILKIVYCYIKFKIISYFLIFHKP